MIAKLYAQKIIDDVDKENGRTYANSPSKLKSEIAKCLIELGREDLIVE